MKRTFGRRLGIFLLGFALFFLFRLTYGYMDQPNGEVINGARLTPQASSDFELSRKNYAGQKGGGVGAGPLSVDQRYEKVAKLGMVSDDFDADEMQLRQLAKEAEALIQHEQAFGLEGRRQLQLALGVNPTRFEDVIEQLRMIGRPVSFQVDKTDKTNEYRELLARQESLRKSRDNLVALKSRDAELSDLISLETQILGLESQIQSLGVSVGEFDSEFEFVTIKLTMSEVAPPRVRNIGFLQRAKVALEWAVGYYLGLMAALFFMSVAAFLGVLALRWARQLSNGASETDK